MTTSSSEDGSRQDAKAKMQMQRFYDRLESLLKRHQPVDYAPFAASILKEAIATPNRLGIVIPPHRVLHSIEANCRYARGQNHDPVDLPRFVQVLNVYSEHEDPLHSGLASQSIDHLFLALHREQIELQHIHARGDLARDLRLFVADDPLPQLATQYTSETGLTIEEWFKLAFVTWAAAHRDPRGCFTKETVLSAEVLGIAPQQAEAYFTAASRTPAAIGKRFTELRESLKPQCHSLIRSVFLEAPIIDFGGGNMLAPQPSLVLRHSGHGLYRLLRDLPHFDSEFGDSFERYVGQVLRSTTGHLRCLDKRQLEKVSPGKSCDFLVELPDAVLLAEAKAVTFTANLLTENAIVRDNSTAKVAKAIEQIYTTAHELRQGALTTVSVPPTKPILGVVVTYGDLPLANSLWYFNNFFLKRAESKLKPPIYPSTAMERLPIVMPIHVLELFVVALNHLGLSVSGLCEEKESQPYLKVGDWNTFLAAKLRESQKADLQLALAREQLVRFLESLGFDRERAKQI